LQEWITPIFQGQRPKRFLFRVDAGRVAGLSFGHLERCLLLSQLFRQLFLSEHLFLMRDYAEGVGRARHKGEQVKEFCGSIEERELLLQTVEEFQADWLVVDLPYDEMDCSFFPELRKRGCKIIFIDDARFMDPQADVVLNSSILAPHRLRGQHAGTTYLLGPSYFIFERTAIPPPVAVLQNKIRILLTFGGSDPTGITLKVLDALLSRSWPGVLLSVVLGPGFGEVDRVRELVQGREQSYQVLVNPENLLKEAMASELTICAGGRTMYELSCLNRPFMGVATAPHEAEAIEAFCVQGLARAGLLHWQPTVFLDTLQDIVLELQGTEDHVEEIIDD